MRVRLTDGDRTIDIRTTDDTPLPDVEATALRLLLALPPRHTPPPTEDAPAGAQHEPGGDPLFGFSIDGTSLTADTERSDQVARPERYTEWGDDRT